MSDWEIAPKKVTNNNIKEFAGIENGYAGGSDTEDPVANIKQIDDELANVKHPVARKALLDARESLQARVDGWEVAPKAGSPSGAGSNKSPAADSGWEVAPKADAPAAGKFESGSAFKDTKDLIPSWKDISDTWDTLKKQWENRHNTPMTVADAQKMMKDEHSAGSGVLDAVGALPAMVAGGAHGIYSAIKNKDATQGLKDANETMGNLLPSSLMGNKEDQQGEGYKAAMAPYTAIMDTLNAVPQGYGEILHSLGNDKAAAQVTDAGKLGVMVGAGATGLAHFMKKGGADKAALEAADKLEKLQKIEPTLPVDQPPAEVGTAAHADDFAAINPYDVGGHVTDAMEGRPSTIDNAQGDLFGSKTLEEAQPSPDMGQASIAHDTVPFTKESGLALADEPYKHENGIDYTTPDSDLSLVPKDDPNVRNLGNPEATKVGTRDTARAKAREVAAEEQYRQDQQAQVEATKKAAFDEAAQMKDRDFSHMEADKQFQFAEAIKNIEQGTGPARRAFLNQDLMDFQHLADNVGDRTLMAPEHNLAMTDALRKGDPRGALDVLAKNHPSVLYRKLATFMSDKLNGLQLKLHDEPTLKLGDREVTGYYDPETNTVGLTGLGATSPHTVMHEIAHGLTSYLIKNRPMDFRVKALQNLFHSIPNLEKNFPGIVNAREFIAEAFSNPKFQEFLKDHRAPDGRSLFRKFVDGVKNMLGLKSGIDTHLGSALDHAIDLGKQIMAADEQRHNALQQFKDAGMPSKLADLMATKPEDAKLDTKVFNGESVIKGIPGLTDAISDFKFYDKPIGEIIEMAKNSPDIPNSAMEKLAQKLQAGGLFESLKTRNPVVKQTYERVTRAWQESSHNIKEYLTDPKTGLVSRMRDLNANEKAEIHAVMMEHEGQRELSSMELAAAGLNEKQIAYYNKYRELSNKFFEDLNTQRARLGLAPMDARVGHMAGRFMGDFAQMVYKDGKVVGRISGNTKWDLQRASKYMMEKHPEFEFGPHEYNAIGKGRRPADRFGGLMEALNFLSKADGDVGKLMESYRDYLQKDAINFRNTMQHAKAKVKEAGGIIGSEGNKPWEDMKKNAEEGMKAQLSYFEQGYEWMSMEQAVNDLKPLLSDEGVIKQAPNAVEWAQQYVNHSMGRGQGKIADFTNSLVSMMGEATGIGHTNLLHGNAQLKHLVMQKFMGLMNIPFSLTQLLQPLAVQPAMVRLLRARGLEFSTAAAQLHATETYLHSLIEGHDSPKLNAFEKQAMQYADKMSIFDVKMADHTKDINASKLKDNYNKLADFNITAPEHLTRGMSFLFYSHLLKDAGVPLKDVFGAAENMTNFTMVNYHPIERPMGYAKLGWIGDVASTLTRYKHNQYSQLAFYAREGLRAENGLKSSVPMATFLGSALAFGGIMGFFAYNEADSLFQLFSEHVLKKPNSLTNVVLGSGAPELLTHGLFSTVGLDMTTRFSNANLLPNSIGEALMPYGSAVLDTAQATGRFILDPTSTTKQKQLVKSLAPQSVQGLLENTMFTEKKGPNKNLYINNTDGPNIGKGRVYRTDDEMTERAFGFRSVKESKELTKNYSDSQIEKQHANIVERTLTKVKYEAMDGSLTSTKLQRYVNEAAQHGEDPSAFIGKYVSWGIDRQLSQSQQQLLQNAKKGFKGAFNIKNEGP